MPMHVTVWVAFVSFAVAVSFTIAAGILHANRTDSLPAKIYCDLSSQYLSTGKLVSPSNVSLVECGPQVNQRWLYVGVTVMFLVGTLFMYAEKNSSYNQAFRGIKVSNTDQESEELKGVLQPSSTRSVPEKKPSSIFCCGCFDGFFITHILTVPFLWFFFCLCQGSSTASWITGTLLFEMTIGYTKALSVMDRTAAYAAVSGDTIWIYMMFEFLYIAWWGVSVWRTYIFDTDRGSVTLVVWWFLILFYTMFVSLVLIWFRVLRNESINKRPVAAVTMQETRIYIVMTDLLFMFSTGVLLFVFVY